MLKQDKNKDVNQSIDIYICNTNLKAPNLLSKTGMGQAGNTDYFCLLSKHSNVKGVVFPWFDFFFHSFTKMTAMLLCCQMFHCLLFFCDAQIIQSSSLNCYFCVDKCLVEKITIVPVYTNVINLVIDFKLKDNVVIFNTTGEISPRNALRTDTEKTTDSILNKISLTSNVCRP